MIKGQSLVIQFLLFFLIGLTVFISISGFFRLQSDLSRDDIVSSNKRLIGNFLSSYVIQMQDSCKQCDFINISTTLVNTTGSYGIRVSAGNTGLDVSTKPFGKNYLSPIHNLNYTLTMSGSGSSVRPLILTLTKTQNKLEVSQ